MHYVLQVETMLVVEAHQFESSVALSAAAGKNFEGPGQKQTGTAGHAPSPSIQTRLAASRRPERTPLFLSRPTYSAPALSLRKLFQHVQKVYSA
jgi:hypothetical protein